MNYLVFDVKNHQKVGYANHEKKLSLLEVTAIA